MIRIVPWNYSKNDYPDSYGFDWTKLCLHDLLTISLMRKGGSSAKDVFQCFETGYDRERER